MSRSLDEIVRVLQALKSRHSLVMTYLPNGKFQAPLRYVDPGGRRLIIGNCRFTNGSGRWRRRCVFRNHTFPSHARSGSRRGGRPRA